MLIHTFCHLSRIGLKREQSLWSKGITSWNTLLDHLVSEKDRYAAFIDPLQKEIDLSFKNLQSKDPKFFADKLPVNQGWRLFGDFKENAVYLDIETTGISIPVITAISLYDGKDIRCYVYGKNLENFIDDIQNFQMIITYNGKNFDIPVIESFFNIKLHQAHIDLRHILKRLGYTGGLKGCEKQAGISRGNLDGVDGYFAVLLWSDYYYNGNIKALDTLLAYNIEDVVNLEKLMILAYNKNIARIDSIKIDPLPEPADPIIPFQPDVDTIQQIKRRYGL